MLSTSKHASRGKDESVQDVKVVLARVVAHVHGTPTDRARGGVETARDVFTLKHVPIRDDYLAHEDGVVHDVGDVDCVARLFGVIKIIARASQSSRFVVINVLRGVTHAIDDAVFGKVRPNGLLERHVHAPGKRRPTAVFITERADDGLRVNLDPVDVRRR